MTMQRAQDPSLRDTLLLAALLLAACDQRTADNSTSMGFFVREEHNGSELAVRPGTTFDVRLRGNATIDPPVEWSLVAAQGCVSAVGSDVVSDDPDADGAGATWIFRFRATGEGQGRLALHGGASDRRYSLTVVCDDTVVYD